MNVQIPVKWVQELLALCGPEDHELRERVMVSITAMNEQAAGPVVTPEPDAAIKEVMELVGAAMDSAMKAGELLLDSHEKFNAQFASAKSLKNSIESKLRALLATATGLPAQAVRQITRTEFPNSPATRALTAFCEAMRDNGIQGDDMRAAMLWFLGLEEVAPQAQADARDALDVLDIVKKLPRHTYGYKGDEWGMNQSLRSYEAPDGAFLLRSEVLNAIAAQAAQGGEA